MQHRKIIRPLRHDANPDWRRDRYARRSLMAIHVMTIVAAVTVLGMPIREAIDRQRVRSKLPGRSWRRIEIKVRKKVARRG